MTPSGGMGGGTTSQGGNAGSGGANTGGNTGGAAADPNCAVPEGAADTVKPGLVAQGYLCTRFPYPLIAPRDVIETTDGRVFVSEFGAGRIVELTANGFVTIAENLAAPIGLREENATTLLVTEEGKGSLARIDKSTGARTLIANQLHHTTYLSLGPDGAAYVSSFEELANTKKGIVWRVSLQDKTAVPYATGLNVAEGLFFDAAENLAVADWLLPSAVYRYPQGGGTIDTASTVGSGFNNIYGLADDKNGGFYAGDHAGSVVHVSAAGDKTPIVSQIGRPGGIWVSKNNDLWVAEFTEFGKTGYLLKIKAVQ